MAVQRQVDEHTHDQETTGKALKRRGILAAAAALVAGIAAKQTSQPVAAHDANDLGLGTGFVNNTTTTTTLSYFGSVPPNAAILTVTDGGARPTGTTVAALAGFALENGDSAAVNVGVYGATLWSNTDAAGVRGEHFGNGTGVTGTSASGRGVYGVSGGDNGVYGNTNAPVNSGKAGVGGIGNGAGTYGVIGFGGGGIGVRGTSTSGVGVYGDSTGNYGVLGQSAAVGFAGITGITTTANVPAFAGGSTVGTALAARFNGGVYVDCTSAAGGQFVVNPMSAKSGLLKHPDGSHRLMYSVEAPESWAEDFGEASLVGGKADVKIDPDFAAMMHTDTYHVFLTGYDDSNGLYVTGRSATGFTVREHKGGMSSGTFSWRLVARPKVENHTATRLAKYDLPAPLHMPTKDELPTAVQAPPAGKKP